MATFNANATTATNADVLSSSVAAATAAATTFLVPSTTAAAGTVAATSLQLEPYGALPAHTQFVNAAGAPLHHQQTTNSSTSSYTFVQIKREPCQVSEITSNNCNLQQHHHHHHQQHHHHQHHSASTSLTATGVGTVSSSSVTASASSKTMSSSTLTTLVKIEASSPKVLDMDKQNGVNTLSAPPPPLPPPPLMASTSNSVPIGIAVARKRPQESNSATLNSTTTMSMQQPLNKDMNCFGIRVADLGGVGTGCGNIYFTGNGDLMTSSAAAEELALSAAGVQNVNRTPSTFWQYPNALPIESVISMSPATVGLQYSREASRGQVVLLPAAPATLDPFQQAAAAAAFVWPSAYIPQATAATTPAAAAAAAAAALQPPPNFIFPSMGAHSTLSATPSYATSLQLYLAAAAAGNSTQLCQHTNQQTNQTSSTTSSTTNSFNLSSSSTTSSRFLSLAPPPTPHISDLAATTPMPPTTISSTSLLPKHTASLMPAKQLPVAPFLMPPTALKIEEYNATEFKHTMLATQQLAGLPPPPPLTQQTTALNFDTRHGKLTTTMSATTTAANLLELQSGVAQQALNLVRLPTPPTSATIETVSQQQPQILFHANGVPPTTTQAQTHTPALLNLSMATASSVPPIIGPPTPAPCDEGVLNFKTTPVTSSPLTPPQIVVGVQRATPLGTLVSGSTQPQMQDVNIQTDTPVCSEDENSSCPLGATNIPQHMQTAPAVPSPPLESPNKQEYAPYSRECADDAQQPLELVKNNGCINECHNQFTPSERPLEPQALQPVTGPSQLPSETPQQAAEDLTGLELLSNISTNSTPLVRVKQEPLEPVPEAMPAPRAQLQQVTTLVGHQTLSVPMPEMMTPVEPLGGLNLLCALAEQRIQEEEVQGSLFATPSTHSTPTPSPPPTMPTTSASASAVATATETLSYLAQSKLTPSCFSFLPRTQSPGFRLEPGQVHNNTSSPAFPSMEGIELPSTSGLTGSEYGAANAACVGTPVKRKKHKHSKSPSSASDGRKSSQQQQQTPQRCSKKNKKKRKHKQPSSASEELDVNDEELQADLRSALNTLDPNYQRFGQWPNPQQLFSIMESSMRIRLADITRQYRKKKRKLDEMGKHKKKKKCSKALLQQQQQPTSLLQQPTSLLQQPTSLLQQPTSLLQQQTTQPQLSLTSTLSALHTGSTLGTSSPLRDYKFSTFALSSNGPGSTSNGLNLSSAASTYLQPSSFLRFTDKTHAFPPPLTKSNDITPPNTSSVSTYVRLEPSALDAANHNRGSSNSGNTVLVTSSVSATPSTSAARLAHKHAATEKNTQKNLNKEQRKLLSASTRATTPAASTTALTTATITTTAAAAAVNNNNHNNINMQQSNHTKRVSRTSAEMVAGTMLVKPNPAVDRTLQLTSEHLYRDETRVLTDMGGLFYAGVMKPLQPPDVYAVTLDGERGNKSHIMSREEIFKDTILEVAPKSVESVPVGTRLCAYWSQQYRCLYPGRAIESEVTDDGITPQDFVSVEFDDGDSGRIRLKNIRLLLSDYPIVEYNDNPLYSLGKQKKSALRADEHNSLSGDDHHSHHGFAISSDNTTSLAATMELFTKRSEKKRLKKSLKRKSQNATPPINGAIAAAAVGAVATANANGNCIDTSNGSHHDLPLDNDGNAADGNRKHHKHKKRKKHKKHHRKAEAENQNYATSAATTEVAATSSIAFAGKRELNTRENGGCVRNGDQDDEMMEDEEHLAKNGNTEAMPTALRVAATIKMEAVMAPTVTTTTATTLASNNLTTSTTTTAGMGNVKVKTEQLEIEEETTSNMMSEVSDEAKGEDVVGHNNTKGSSKIAAFLPDRQLWGWFGTAYRKAGVKGRARKQFYKTIKRGKEMITVGDCAVFLSTGRPDRPYIGRIESMWETTSGNKVVRVRWFYHPEETSGCPNLKYPGALFESPHEDENDVQTISHRCEVLDFLRYFGKFGDDSKQYQTIYDNNDTYYLAGYYNPRLLVLKLQDDIPTLEELQNTTDV